MTIITPEQNAQIETLRAAGFGYKRIARQLKLNANTVKSRVRRNDSSRNLPAKIKVYRGKLTPRNQLEIKKYIRNYPTASLEQVIAALDLRISRATLFRFLRRFGYVRKLAKRSIILSTVNKDKRVLFAKKMLQRSDDELAQIMWSDETKVKTSPNGELVFFRAPIGTPAEDEFKIPRTPGGGIGVMFWGCMTRHAYGPLVVVEGDINGEKYLEILREYVLPEIAAAPYEIIFQHDNAPAHKKSDVVKFLENQDFETLEWPPQSPDLSPIEPLWNVIKMKFKALHPRPTTKKGIIDAVLGIYDSLEDHIRVSLVDKFRSNLKKCIKNKGGIVRS